MRVQCSWQIPPNKAAEDVQRCRAKAQYDLTIQRGFEKTCAHLRCANSMNTDHPLQSLSSFEVLESLNQIAHCSRNLQEPPGISRVQNFLFKRLFPSAKDLRTSPRSSNGRPIAFLIRAVFLSVPSINFQNLHVPHELDA